MFDFRVASWATLRRNSVGTFFHFNVVAFFYLHLSPEIGTGFGYWDVLESGLVSMWNVYSLGVMTDYVIFRVFLLYFNNEINIDSSTGLELEFQ